MNAPKATIYLITWIFCHIKNSRFARRKFWDAIFGDFVLFIHFLSINFWDLIRYGEIYTIAVFALYWPVLTFNFAFFAHSNFHNFLFLFQFYDRENLMSQIFHVMRHLKGIYGCHVNDYYLAVFGISFKRSSPANTQTAMTSLV